jgi:hypothetical protein
MMISSRTPEGESNYCLVCGKDARIEPSTVPTRDAPCPHCGHLLWFTKPSCSSDARPRSYEGFVMRLGKAKFGPFPSELQGRLVAAIGLLARQERLPGPSDFVQQVLSAGNWQEVVFRIEILAQRGVRNSWAYTVGAFVRRHMKWILAKR